MAVVVDHKSLVKETHTVKNNNIVSHWLMVSLILFAGTFLFMPSAMCQDPPDKAKLEAEEATIKKKAGEEAAADKAVEDLLRQVNPVAACEDLKEHIRRIDEFIARWPNDRMGDLSAIENMNRLIKYYEREINDAAKTGNKEKIEEYTYKKEEIVRSRSEIQRSIAEEDSHFKKAPELRDAIKKRISDCMSKITQMDIQYNCLALKYPELKRSTDKRDQATDTKTNQSFAWNEDKQAWINTKTLESICPPQTEKFDTCLIGTWVSESYEHLQKSGGAGIHMEINSEGGIYINYNGMKEIKQVVRNHVPSTNIWSGLATGHITTSKGLVNIMSVGKTELEGKETDAYGTKKVSVSGLGPVFISKPYQINYTCDGATLVIKITLETYTIDTFIFKHAKKEP